MFYKESVAIFAAGLLQGIALVAFPAVSTIFTSSSAFNFSNLDYGSLFIPQVCLSIISAALNPFLCRTYSSKKVFLAGLAANFAAMFLLTFSAAFEKSYFSYTILLTATGFLGLGFGLSIPTYNSMIALIYPKKIDTMLLLLNALLGLGTALAPIFISLFVLMGFWWGLPLILMILIALLSFYSQSLSLPGGNIPKLKISDKKTPLPPRLWLFAFFAFLYGIIETLNGNWVSIYLKTDLNATIAVQSFALAAFWGMITFGRVIFAALNKVGNKIIFQISPFICGGAFLLIASLSEGEEKIAILAFGIMGLGCSTLLPLTISFGTEQMKYEADRVPGTIISFYLLGYGISAFGVGPLEAISHLDLKAVYIIGALIAVLTGILSFFITFEKTSKQPKESF